MQSFGVKMRQKELRDTFRKVSRLFSGIICRLSQRLLARQRGSYSAKGRVSAFYAPSIECWASFLRTLLRTLSLLKETLQASSKNPSKKHLLLEKLLRTLRRVACSCMTPLVCTLPVQRVQISGLSIVLPLTMQKLSEELQEPFQPDLPLAAPTPPQRTLPY